MRAIKTTILLLTAFLATSCFSSISVDEFPEAIVGTWEEYKAVYFDVNPPETVYLSDLQHAEYNIFTFYENGTAVVEAIEKGGYNRYSTTLSYEIQGRNLYLYATDYSLSMYISRLSSSELCVRYDGDNADVYFKRLY